MGNPTQLRLSHPCANCVNFWLKLNRGRERGSRVAILSGDGGGGGDSVSRSTSLLLVHFRPLPYEIWRVKEGRKDRMGVERTEGRRERVLARITARVITPGTSGAGVTFNRFDALHGPENEAVDAMILSAPHSP